MKVWSIGLNCMDMALTQSDDVKLGMDWTHSV